MGDALLDQLLSTEEADALPFRVWLEARVRTLDGQRHAGGRIEVGKPIEIVGSGVVELQQPRRPVVDERLQRLPFRRT